MSFRKTAKVDILGVRSGGSWTKRAYSKVSSFYMDNSGVINVEAALDSVSDAYRISRDPRDYLYIPVRANSADRPNNNMDGWELNELQRFDDIISTKVYKTYNLKPHFVNHNASNLGISRGVILDSYLNMDNDADDNVKRAIFDYTGRDVDKDVFVELLVAVDTSKDPSLSDAYRNGSVSKFSMGCDVTATKCSICDNIATTDFELCKCIRGKHARIPQLCKDGKKRLAWEKCLGTIFQEISAVDDPADETATVQEGLLKVAGINTDILNINQMREITAFIVEHVSDIPDSVAYVLNKALSKDRWA